ncbi:MAG: hypothetical protein AB1578_14845 [Thermodesulfobacteriota bacterium]
MGENETFDPGRLRAEGWQRRSVASEPRLGEAVAAYRSLGYEVLLVPVLREGVGEGAAACTACLEAGEDPHRYQVIYTREKAGAPDEGEELF